MRPAALAIAIPLVLLLGGCAPGPAPAPTGAPIDHTAEPAAEPLPTIGPPESDTILIVTATVTADNGAELALEMRVHQSSSFDNVATQTLPAALIEDCPGEFTPGVFASQLWSFTRANITAVPRPGSAVDWPADARITTVPSARFTPISGRGFLADADDVASEVPHCLRDKFFSGAGQGGVAVGIPGDSSAGGPQAAFTRWANHNFGFDVAAQSGADVTFADCSFEVTPLGKSLNGGAAGWTSIINADTCTIGAAAETHEY